LIWRGGVVDQSLTVDLALKAGQLALSCWTRGGMWECWSLDYSAPVMRVSANRISAGAFLFQRGVDHPI
jgi:hypothetical protein